MQKIDRLERRVEFLRIAAAKKKWIEPGVILQMDKAEKGAPRVGFTASKKVGNAVARNRAKRRLREALRNVVTKCRPIGDIVLIARPGTNEREWQKLLTDIETGIGKLNKRMLA